MKKLSTTAFEPWSLTTTLLLNVIIGLVLVRQHVSFGFAFLIFVFTNLFNYAIQVNKLYQFEYDNKFLVVTNAWYPFLHVRYNLKDIDRIEVNSYNGLGNAIDIHLNGRKIIYASMINVACLDDMVNEINLFLKVNNKKH